MARLTLHDPFSDVFPELFRGILTPVRAADSQPLEIRIDVKESPTAYTVHAELPGVAKQDIHVEIEGNRVSISGEVKRQSEQKEGERVLRSERYFGTVARTFALASDLDDAKAEALFENGVLTLSLPKRAAPGGRKLAIG